jgi:hypothetical protein
MAGWVEVHPERVARRLPWLHCMLSCSESKHVGLDGINIVHGYVEVELLRPFSCRPCRRGEFLSQLEGQSNPVDREDDPVLFGDVDFPAEDTAVELR